MRNKITFTEAQKALIVNRYIAEDSVKDIAATFGCSIYPIYDVLKEAKATRKKGTQTKTARMKISAGVMKSWDERAITIRNIAKADKVELIGMSKGMPVTEIIRHTQRKYSRRLINKVLDINNESRPYWDGEIIHTSTWKRYTNIQKAKAWVLYLAGLGCLDIQDATGVKDTYVNKMMRNPKYTSMFEDITAKVLEKPEEKVLIMNFLRNVLTIAQEKGIILRPKNDFRFPGIKYED